MLLGSCPVAEAALRQAVLDDISRKYYEAKRNKSGFDMSHEIREAFRTRGVEPNITIVGEIGRVFGRSGNRVKKRVANRELAPRKSPAKIRVETPMHELEKKVYKQDSFSFVGDPTNQVETPRNRTRQRKRKST